MAVRVVPAVDIANQQARKKIKIRNIGREKGIKKKTKGKTPFESRA
jgi:hypothetical protein